VLPAFLCLLPASGTGMGLGVDHKAPRSPQADFETILALCGETAQSDKIVSIPVSSAGRLDSGGLPAVVNEVPGCSLHGDRHAGLVSPRELLHHLAHLGSYRRCHLWLSPLLLVSPASAFLSWVPPFWLAPRLGLALPCCPCALVTLLLHLVLAAGRHCVPSCGTLVAL
jgi:hypothetical protein